MTQVRLDCREIRHECHVSVYKAIHISAYVCVYMCLSKYVISMCICYFMLSYLNLCMNALMSVCLLLPMCVIALFACVSICNPCVFVYCVYAHRCECISGVCVCLIMYVCLWYAASVYSYFPFSSAQCLFYTSLCRHSFVQNVNMRCLIWVPYQCSNHIYGH